MTVTKISCTTCQSPIYQLSETAYRFFCIFHTTKDIHTFVKVGKTIKKLVGIEMAHLFIQGALFGIMPFTTLVSNQKSSLNLAFRIRKTGIRKSGCRNPDFLW